MEERNNYIYCHTNKINGKKYIGRSFQNPQKRWRNGEGYKGSPYFYHAIQKYGWDNFEHTILLDNLTLEESYLQEKKFIEMYNSTSPEKGYNISFGGDGCSGRIYSEEEKRAIGERSKTYGKPIKYNGIEYSSIARLADFLGVNYRTLRSWILGVNFAPRWLCEAEIIYDGDIIVLQFITQENRRKLKSDHIKMALSNNNQSGLYNPMYGKHHTEETKQKISKQLKGKYCGENSPNYGKKYNLERRSKTFKKVAQYDLNNNLINIFESLSIASEATGICVSGISNCCHNRTKTCHNFIWKFL